ncbi:MAG: hypothetical protein Q8S33_30425 [Myxococcales bacterium]|nr:hypothetical protein [Myxococcales bacterium]
MKRFAAVLAVISIVAGAGEPAAGSGTAPASTETAPAEKKGVTTVLNDPGAGTLGMRGRGLGTGMSTKPSKPKTTTAPVGTK